MGQVFTGESAENLSKTELMKTYFIMKSFGYTTRCPIFKISMPKCNKTCQHHVFFVQFLSKFYLFSKNILRYVEKFAELQAKALGTHGSLATQSTVSWRKSYFFRKKDKNQLQIHDFQRNFVQKSTWFFLIILFWFCFRSERRDQYSSCCIVTGITII